MRADLRQESMRLARSHARRISQASFLLFAKIARRQESKTAKKAPVRVAAAGAFVDSSRSRDQPLNKPRKHADAPWVSRLYRLRDTDIALANGGGNLDSRDISWLFPITRCNIRAVPSTSRKGGIWLEDSSLPSVCKRVGWRGAFGADPEREVLPFEYY